MRRSLRNRLLASYLLLVALFGGAVVLTLFVVAGISERTQLLIDRYWQDNNLIAQVHGLLSDVALFVSLPPDSSEIVPGLQALHDKIDRLAVQIATSSFREEFREQQLAQLRELKVSLAGPVETLSRLERQNQQADDALQPLLAEATRLGRGELVQELTVAALAYRDYYITANPSDREIFRRQVERIAAQPLSAGMRRAFAAFREQGDAVFQRRLELHESREQVVAQLTLLSDSLRERAEAYARRVVYPVREEIQSRLGTISSILLTSIILSTLAALGISVLLARRISTPLENAAVTLARIEKGDLSMQVAASGSEEVDLLGRAINSLTLSLRQTLDDLQSTVQNLSESEERFRHIAEQRQELERIIRHSPTVAFLCAVAPDFPVVYLSDSVSQFGYAAEEFRSEDASILRLVHGDDRPRVIAAIERLLAEGEEQERFVEFRVQTRTGEIRWVDARLLIQGDPQGGVRLQGVLLDITDKIHLREQAAQASRLAALGELAAGVAHEINNPNATILLNAAVLRDVGEGMLRLLDERWRERGDLELGRMPYARLRVEIPRLQEEVIEAAGRIRNIVEDLREFTSVDPPEFRQPVDLNGVIQAAVRLVGNTLKKATDHFSAEYADGLPALNGHAQRLEQVVVNLLINACQALSDRQQRIIVRSSRLPGERSLLVEVADEGAGIAGENLAHVTDPFFTTRRDRGGTGLGLSISARIVREHGGRLEIDSKLNRGTTVRVVLPLPAEEMMA